MKAQNNYSINKTWAVDGEGIYKASIGELSGREDAIDFFESKRFEIVSFEMDPDGWDAADIAVVKGGVMECYSIDPISAQLNSISSPAPR